MDNLLVLLSEPESLNTLISKLLDAEIPKETVEPEAV